jgi:hypothetical protein
MDVEDEHNHMGAAFGLRDRFGQPATPARECVPGAENRIWKARLQPGCLLSDGERATLAELGRRLGRKGLQQVGAPRQTRYHSRLVSPTGG